MTAGLRRVLREAAEASPAVAVPSGIFDRARRRRRWRAAAAVVAVLAVLALPAGGLLWTMRAAPAPAGAPGDEALPATVAVPPRMTADVRYAPLGAALVVYHRQGLPGGSGDEPEPLAVVGSADRYRVYDRPEWTPAAPGQTFLLSPDGRYLLMPNWGDGTAYRTRVLDLATGAVRTLDAGLPLAWSPGGGQAILVGYDGDPTGSAPVRAEIRVVRMPEGQVLRRIPLPAGAGPQQLSAALSPDGASVAVQRGGTVTIHDGDGDGATASFDVGTATLAGPAAWTPDGADLLVGWATGRLVAVRARTGMPDPDRSYPAVTPDPVPPDAAAAAERVVAWRGADPVVVVGDRALRLSATPEVLVRAPAGTDELQIATAGIGAAPRQPGRPDPGPFLARYRTPVHWLAVLGLVGLAAAWVWWARRRRGGALVSR